MAAMLAWRDGEPFDPTSVLPAAGCDRAVATGPYTVRYAVRGTTAHVFHRDRHLRELTRAEYRATDYDYPLAVGVLPDGRAVLAHCPEEYDRLEIEDLATGERITTGTRDPADVFHSRLELSPDGRHLLSAGWVWHPYGILRVYDLAAALADPATLDGPGVLPTSPGLDAEVASACWLDADRIAVATTGEETLDDDDEPDLGPGELAVWSLSRGRWIHRNRVDEPLGTLLARGGQVVSLFGRPRLLDLATGVVLGDWPEVAVPRRDGAYGDWDVLAPVASVSPEGTRLAVAGESGVTVLELPVA